MLKSYMKKNGLTSTYHFIHFFIITKKLDILLMLTKISYYLII